MAPKVKAVGSMDVVEYPAGSAPPVVGPVIDYVCGLRKHGHNAYSVVSGRIVDGVPELKVDKAAQPLQFASEELRLAFQRSMRDIP